MKLQLQFLSIAIALLSVAAASWAGAIAACTPGEKRGVLLENHLQHR